MQFTLFAVTITTLLTPGLASVLGPRLTNLWCDKGTGMAMIHIHIPAFKPRDILTKSTTVGDGSCDLTPGFYTFCVWAPFMINLGTN